LKSQARQLRAKRVNTDVSNAEMVVSLEIFLGAISAKEFARDLGVSQSYLCDVRHGRRAISDDLLEKLCKLKLSDIRQAE